MKALLILVSLVSISSGAMAANASYDCTGRWANPDEDVRDMNFRYDRVQTAKGVEHQAHLAEAVFIEPMLTNEDTTGWTLEQLINYRTNFITTYSKKGCPNDPSLNPTRFSSSDVGNGSISVSFEVGCGDGFGESSVLTGSCQPSGK